VVEVMSMTFLQLGRRGFLTPPLTNTCVGSIRMTVRRLMLALAGTAALAVPAATSHAGPIRIAYFDCHRSVKKFGDYPADTVLLVHGIGCTEAHRMYLRMVARDETMRIGRFRLRGLRRNGGGPIRQNTSFRCSTTVVVTNGITFLVRCHDNFGDLLRLTYA
jgi:hypothetical protein